MIFTNSWYEQQGFSSIAITEASNDRTGKILQKWELDIRNCGHIYHLKKWEDTTQKSTKQHSIELGRGPHHATEPVNLCPFDCTAWFPNTIPWFPKKQTDHWNHFLCSDQSGQEREAGSGWRLKKLVIQSSFHFSLTQEIYEETNENDQSGSVFWCIFGRLNGTAVLKSDKLRQCIN